MAPVAVIDIGTNTTRLLVAERDDDGDIVELERRTIITSLGQGVDSTGRLADEAKDRVAEAIAVVQRDHRPGRRRARSSRWPRAPCATPRTARSSATT